MACVFRPGRGPGAAAAPAMRPLQRPAALMTLMSGARARAVGCRARSSSGASLSRPQPAIAAKHPYQVDLKAEKRYAWCACGHSKKQPFCDGSHKTAAPEISPLRFQLAEAKSVWLCGCKHTKSPPYCDGTHKEEFIQKAELPGPA